MEAAEELSLGSNHHIIKGKRTKRQRAISPIPFSIPANSSSGDLLEKCNYDSTNTNNNAFSPAAATTASSAECFFQDSTEEEEDMAHCLILLARGRSRESLSKQQVEEDSALNYAKYSSRKFLEAAATTGGAGKAGDYVYECKTCNRTFPSFQALGGHRASHKKPKNMAMAAAAAAAEFEKKQQQQQFMLSSDEEESQFKKNNNVYNQLSLQLNSRGNLNTATNNNNKSKVHECSICGTEFTSGQALGGHMRRHRAPPVNGTSTALSLTPMAMEADEEQPKKQKSVLSLELDLNLPAPEDDQKESKFGFASKQHQQQTPQQQQPDLVFSTPALVDCHY